MTQPQSAQDSTAVKALEAYIAYRALLHSEDQEAIAAGLALKLYPLWAIQRFTELDRSTPLWISTVVPVVKTAYLQSQRVTAVYASDLRYASLPTADPLPLVLPDVELPENVPAKRFSAPLDLIPREAPAYGEGVPRADRQPAIRFDPFPQEDAVESLTISGNYSVKSAMPASEEDAMYVGLKDSSGAAIRHALNGSRNVTNNVVRYDRKIVGWARFTDSDPCYFCALLASRGTVFQKGSFIYSDAKYKEPKTAPDVPERYSRVAKVHDHCRCTLRPVYSRYEKHDRESQFYLDQWDALVNARENFSKTNAELIQLFRENLKHYPRKLASLTEIRGELQSRVDSLLVAGFDAKSPQVKWAKRQIA